FAPGERARAIAETPLLVGVYRELETIERDTRAGLLRASVRVLARALPGSLGAAALDLLAPLVRCRVGRGLARETERRVSERLLRPAGVAPLSVPALDAAADGGSHDVIEGLAQLALALEPTPAKAGSIDARLVALEVRLALDDPSAASVGLGALAEELRAPSVEGPPDATVALDAVERASAAAAFALGDDGAVLRALGSGSLAFDRSASAGAVYAAARHRAGVREPDEGAGERADCFLAPVGSEERARIARFLTCRARQDGVHGDRVDGERGLRDGGPADAPPPPRRRRGAWI
ncbi:MAG: hypothetical protein AAGB93_24385, partial [Planctomycetota bacterium]